MGFLQMIWGSITPGGTPPPEPVSHDEFERVTRDYDRKLEQLEEAIHALRGDEPDRQRDPHAT